MDFVLIVENYITNQRNFISKSTEEPSIHLSDPIEISQINEAEKFQNGSIVKVIMDYYVNFHLKKSTKIKETPMMTVD
jgi:hypothetical protein